jgi:hypothetical protein
LSRLFHLFNKYKADLISNEEREELLTALNDPQNAEEIEAFFLEEWDAFEPGPPVFSEDHADRILQNILYPKQVHATASSTTKVLKTACRIAAILILLLSIGYYFIEIPSGQTSKPAMQSVVERLPPGSTGITGKPVLTLPDGRTIDLEAHSTGGIAAVSGLSIVKTADGHLMYSLEDENSIPKSKHPGVPQYHVISTPPGGQYQINLADGTKVWLNAASSLRFPTHFFDNERTVELTGEAYFEVASHQVNSIKQPFKVVSRDNSGRNQEVTVLGTHFNVQAYHDDPSVKTTLLEGSVRIKNLSSNAVMMLSPGEQSVLTAEGTTVSEVSTDEVMAWKQGRFVFNNDLLANILKQLERWYDLDINYAHIPHTRYQAFISRNVPLTEVIDMLELTGNIKFKIDTIPQTGRVRLKVVN